MAPYLPELILVALLLVGYVAALPLLILRMAGGRRKSSAWLALPPLIGLALGTIGLVHPQEILALEDLAIPPAHVQGLVTDHRLVVIADPGSGGADNRARFTIVVAGHVWPVSADDYALATIGSCVVVAYGPHSGYVRGLRHCARM